MSYCVCHMTKFARGAVKGVEIHNQRKREGISHTNPDIDWNRSGENYDLHNTEGINYYKAIQARIASLNLKKAVRKDAVLLCGFIITSDTDFFKSLGPEATRKYFIDSYKFLKNRYGPENVVAATVHLDEATPHMHFEMVPVVDGRLSAKSLFTKTELKKLQTDFHREVGAKYGLERGIEGSPARHIETARLKLETAEKARTAAIQEQEKAQEEAKKLEEQKKALVTEIKALKGVKKKSIYLDSIQPQKGIGKSIKGVTIEQIEELKRGYIAGLEAQAENKGLKEKNKVLNRQLNGTMQMRLAYGKLEQENRELRAISDEQEETIQNLVGFIERQGLGFQLAAENEQEQKQVALLGGMSL